MVMADATLTKVCLSVFEQDNSKTYG